MPSIINATTTNGVAVSGDTSGALALQTNNGTTALTIDTNQNVGIGTASPGVKLHVVGDGYTSGEFGWGGTGAGANSLGFLATTGGNTAIGSRGATALLMYTNGAERMRITSAGDVIINGTSPLAAAKLSVGFAEDTQQGINLLSTVPAVGGSYMQFYNNTALLAGNIAHTGATTVAYNTSSDHRLKENVQPMTGALAKVALLKPVTYTWIADQKPGQGFIAHELQAVVPDCVTGEKDAVDENGNPIYQGIDVSFLVATLTAAIQELNAKVEAQAAEIAALKGAN